MQAPSGLSGVEASEVDEGDYLLDWRSGGEGLRYVHHFTEAELGKLASASGFRVVESFSSDGETGNLGLYQVWKISRRQDLSCPTPIFLTYIRKVNFAVWCKNLCFWRI
ncbi:MAG: hypothetical protein U0X93_05310 [Anaerolineales bacterium]